MKNYFSHDHHARSDKKLIKVMRVFGLAGIGLYWCIIEMLYEENGWIKLADLENIAYDLRTETATIKTLLNDFDLFFVKGEMFSSKSVQVRLKIMEDKSSLRSKAAKARWDKYKDDANALQMDSNCNAIKGKEIKLNESKLKDINSFKKRNKTPFFFWFKYPKGETLIALIKKVKAKRKKVAPKKEKVEPEYHPLLLFHTPEFNQAFQDFLNFRKQLRKPIIEASYKEFFSKLKKLSNTNEQTAIEILKQSIANGWQGIFELRNGNQNNAGSNQNQQPNTGPSNAVRLAWALAS